MNNNDKIKYYVYLRKSSESEDKQVQSIERQYEEVQKIIDAYSLEVADVFQESRSAKIPDNRMEFSKMITGIKKSYAQGIVCWHINRLSRNPLESGIIQQLLEDGKIKRIVTKERTYTAEDNAIIYSVETGLAAQYSKDLGKMVKSGIDKKVAMGIAPMRAPVGYLNTRYKEHGTNEILKDKQLFSVVRRIWDIMLTGAYTVPQVLNIVNNDLGLKKKTYRKTESVHFTRNGLYNMLCNPFYTGYFLFKGQLRKGIHDPMITMDEFDKVQEIIGRKLKTKTDKYELPFTGILQCKNCRSAITGTEKRKWVKATNSYHSYTYYYCSRKKKGAESCGLNRPITGDELKEIILQKMSEYSIDMDFRNKALKAFKFLFEFEVLSIKETVSYQETEISKLEKEVKNLLALRVGEHITENEFLTEKNERESKMIRLRERLADYENTSMNIEKIFEEKMNSLINISKRLEEESIAGKKSILFKIGSNYTLNEKNIEFRREKWLNHLVSNKLGIQTEIEGLELYKTLNTYNYLCDIETMCPLLRSLMDYVRTQAALDNDIPYQDSS